jgi:predicted kinase
MSKSILVFGAPGSGKSHFIREHLSKEFKENQILNKGALPFVLENYSTRNIKALHVDEVTHDMLERVLQNAKFLITDKKLVLAIEVGDLIPEKTLKDLRKNSRRFDIYEKIDNEFVKVN